MMIGLARLADPLRVVFFWGGGIGVGKRSREAPFLSSLSLSLGSLSLSRRFNRLSAELR